MLYHINEHIMSPWLCGFLYKDNCLIQKTGNVLDDTEFHCATGNRFFVCPKCLDHQWGPTGPSSLECQGFFRSHADGTWSWPSKVKNEWKCTSTTLVYILYMAYTGTTSTFTMLLSKISFDPWIMNTILKNSFRNSINCVQITYKLYFAAYNWWRWIWVT